MERVIKSSETLSCFKTYELVSDKYDETFRCHRTNQSANEGSSHRLLCISNVTRQKPL